MGFGDGADFEGGSVSVVGLRLKRVHWRRSRFTLCSETRSPAQKPAHKDLERNGQARAITLKATYAPVSNRAGSRSLIDLRCQIFILKQVMIVIHAKRG